MFAGSTWLNITLSNSLSGHLLGINAGQYECIKYASILKNESIKPIGYKYYSISKVLKVGIIITDNCIYCFTYKAYPFNLLPISPNKSHRST